MKKTLFLVAACALFGAGCSSSSTVATQPSPTPSAPTAPSPSPSAPAPSAAPAAAPGATLQVTLTGSASESGTFPANCGYAYPGEQKGAVFQSSFHGWQLSLVDDSGRTPGAQPSPAGKWILNGPQHSYMSKEGVNVSFGPDLKSATVKGTFASGLALEGPSVNVDGTFHCE